VETYDVIVIGGGSAAFDAAVAAKERGAERVLMLEKAAMPAIPVRASVSGTRVPMRSGNSFPTSMRNISRVSRSILIRKRISPPTLGA